MPPQNVKSIFLLGCRVDSVQWKDIEAFCRHALESTKPHHIITINGEHILAAQSNPQYREIINQADLNIPDTTNIVWVSRLKGFPIKQKTPGSDLTLRLAKLATEKNSRVYLLGGRGAVAQKAAQKLKEYYPNLIIAGTSNKNPDDETAIQDIIDSRADIVLIAYGAPTHEFWIDRYKNKTGAKLLVGIGGTFDMLAGVLPRAPHWMRVLNLEWLWRLFLQPSRIGRIWNAVVVFPIKSLFSK